MPGRDGDAPSAFRDAKEKGRAELARLSPRVPTLRVTTSPAATTLKNVVVQVNGPFRASVAIEPTPTTSSSAKVGLACASTPMIASRARREPLEHDVRLRRARRLRSVRGGIKCSTSPSSRLDGLSTSGSFDTMIRRLDVGYTVLCGGLFILGAARCSSFAANEPAGDGGVDAAYPAADAADAAEQGVGDSGADSAHRTGVLCRQGQCAVGESCCSDGTHEDVCASDCSDAGAAVYVYQCGQPSDCAPGQVCCGAQNGSSNCGGNLTGSSCVGVGNCSFCDGDGGGDKARLCDKATNEGCAQGTNCSRTIAGHPYSACSW